MGRDDYTATNNLVTCDESLPRNLDASYASGPGGELQVTKLEYLKDMISTGKLVMVALSTYFTILPNPCLGTPFSDC